MCQHYGVPLNSDARGVCPFHDDHDPSLQLRKDEDGIERWHCWPCGFGGDLFDFIQRHDHVSFPEAITRAEAIYDSMPPQWTPSFTLKNDRAPAEDSTIWGPMVEEAKRRGLGQNDGMICVISELVDLSVQDVERRQIDRTLRDVWQWGVDDRGNILIPHRNQLNEITGVKVRAIGGFKWARSGSRYETLYGAWLPRKHRDLILCEGESDAVWAYLQSPGCDVRALPSGAQTMKDHWITEAAQWDTVYLAFDADHAGVGATRVWLEELGDKARVCRLPRGHDLRSAQPDIQELLAEAIRPTATTGAILVQGGSFHRVVQQGTRPLTSWYCEPTARLIPADNEEGVDPAIEIEIDYAGRKFPDVLAAPDLQSSAKLKQWAGRRSLDCVTGDSDVQLLQSYLMARAQVLPDVYQTSRLGIHDPPHRYRYAGRTLVLPDSYVGKLPWRYVGPAELKSKVHLADQGPISWSWLHHALHLNTPEVMHPILAWYAATIRRQEVLNFPLLFVGGSSGAGKSTIAQLLCQMFGSQLGAQLGAITAFPLMRLLSSSTTLPVFIDEWSRQSRADTRDSFQGNIPIIYEGGIAERGRADQTVVQYRCTSPVVVAGEDTFALDREQDRMITVEVSRAGQSVQSLSSLAGQPLENFGYWYNRWFLDAETVPLVPSGRYKTRPEYNAAILQCGWDTLRSFMEHAAHYDPDVPELPRTPDLSLVLDRRQAHENEYESLIREALGMTDQNGNDLVWTDDTGTWLRFKALTSPDMMRKLDINLPGGAGAMKRYFESRGYTIESRRVSLPFSRRTMYASQIIGYFPQDED